jgi:hypothetical protein
MGLDPQVTWEETSVRLGLASPRCSLSTLLQMRPVPPSGPSVKIDIAISSSTEGRPRPGQWKALKTAVRRKSRMLAPTIDWITNKLNWSDLKPVIRSAISAWICLLLLLGPKTGEMMGQVSSSHRL